jgi:uncharacterized membrane protein YkvA (DUF1232 family)
VSAGRGLRTLLRALPGLARMVGSLLRDPSVPVAAKIALAALALYLASPIDFVPDFIPLLGYLDDILIAAVVIDGLLNVLDRSVLLRYWPGSPQSLDAAARVARRLAAWVPYRVKVRIFGGRPGSSGSGPR